MHPLIQAAELIEQHLTTLNTESAPCDCCGHMRYEDFNQYNRHKELTAIARKLRHRYSVDNSETGATPHLQRG